MHPAKTQLFFEQQQQQQQQKNIKHFSPWVASCIFTIAPVQWLHVRLGGRAVLDLLISLI